MPFRRREDLLPFPSVDEAVKSEFAVSELALRPFGLYEGDLDIDFERTPYPILVTQLIERCTCNARKEGVDESFYWRLQVGKRIECLLNLLLSEAGPEISVAFRCPNATCGERSEIGISVEELAALQEEAYATDRINVALGSAVLTLRRPTGSDQLAWLGAKFADKEAALNAMLRTLLLTNAADEDVLSYALRDEWLEKVDEAMEDHDPLVNFKLWVKCPSCESDHPVAIDLEELSLHGLRQAQLRLLGSVHRLAARYHWSEQQIFAVPHWRRTHYLSLIESERSR